MERESGQERMLYRSEQTLLGYLPAVEGPGRVEGGSPPAPSATVIRSRNYSLLITDDDQRFRDSLRGIFETEGFQTFLAGSGEEALDIIRDRPVDLALLDQHLPRLTGLETLRIIRQMNALLPVILVTGGSTQQLMREALSAQAFTVIPKPVSRSVVVYTVERALTQYFDALRRATDHDQRDRMP